MVSRERRGWRRVLLRLLMVRRLVVVHALRQGALQRPILLLKRGMVVVVWMLQILRRAAIRCRCCCYWR